MTDLYVAHASDRLTITGRPMRHAHRRGLLTVCGCGVVRITRQRFRFPRWLVTRHGDRDDLDTCSRCVRIIRRTP